ncbi:MAG: hypothetical protein ACIAQU_11445 [Phycisphaerales bacterium JB064]
MKRVLPTILTLVIAGCLWLIDPVRDEGPMISLSEAIVGTLPATPTGWMLGEATGDLPHAFPPHNAITQKLVVYNRLGRSEASVFLRVVIAQDRRDLLAYEPTHAMRAGGWQPESALEVDGLWHTEHSRRSQLLDEVITVDTVYIVPGMWSAQFDLLDDAGLSGSGWPGPGAIVQLIISAEDGVNAQPFHDFVKAMAENVADRLGDASP